MHTITVMAHDDRATLETLKKYREIIRERARTTAAWQTPQVTPCWRSSPAP